MVALALLTTNAPEARPLFPNPVFAVDGAPIAIAVGDLDRDGHQDLAVAAFTRNQVAVLLGAGDGTFVYGDRFPVGERPLAVAIADFDADHLPDLVVLNDVSGDVSLLPGLGDGTFKPETRFGIGAPPPRPFGSAPANHALAVADFDRDGALDLAVATQADVCVLPGRSGSFAAPTRIPAGERPRAVTVGDFNLDGLPDLAVANYLSSDVSVALGRGDGAFEPERRFASGIEPRAIATADFNRDGRLDLAVPSTIGVNPTNSRADVAILLGNGDGGFSPPARYETGADTFSVVIHDFDRDSVLDLATADGGSDEASVLRGRGDGTFHSATRYRAGRVPTAVASADFNEDGAADLVLTTPESDNVTVLLGEVAGSFGPQNRIAIRTAHMASGDFNLDGARDLAVVSDRRVDSDDLTVLVGGGDGTYMAAGRFETGFDPLRIAVGDLNADKAEDIVVVNNGSHDLSVFLGRGDGEFDQGGRFTTGFSPTSVVLVDFNGDAMLDAATSNSDSNNVSLMPGRGDGTFPVADSLGAGLYPHDLVAGDFNLDGVTDLAVANWLSDEVSSTLQGSVSLFLGQAAGGFRSGRHFASGQGPAALVAADLDGDGPADLALANRGDWTLSTLLSRGDGCFDPPTSVPLPPSPAAIAAGDLNRDGMTDLVVASSRSGVFSLLLGLGDGTFEPEQRFLTGGRPGSVALDDVNADGFLDVLAGGEDLWVILGQGFDADGDGFAPPDDCDESDPGINPAAVDLPGNLVDENCDGDSGACSPCQPWESHGSYVTCVARAAGALLRSGSLSHEEFGALLAMAAGSDIARRGSAPQACPP